VGFKLIFMNKNLPPRDLVLMAIIFTIVLFVKAYKVDQSVQSQINDHQKELYTMYK